MSLDSFDDKNSCNFHCDERDTNITRFDICGPSTSLARSTFAKNNI